jgi:hypothetical protein
MKIKSLVASALLISVGTFASFAQTAEELVAKNIAARGGADKLKAITSLVQDNSLAVQGMELSMKMTTLTGKGFRTELDVMGSPMVTAIDGNTGWAILPSVVGGSGNAEDLPSDQLKGAIEELDPVGSLFNYQQKGSTIELVGKEQVNGKDAFNLKVTNKNGYVKNIYLDATTFLEIKTKATINQAGQEFVQEAFLSNYKEVEGIKFAFSQEMTSPMGGTMTMTCNKIVLNSPVDTAIFKKPSK